MSFFKLLPIAALGAAGVLGTQAMRKSTDAINSLTTSAALTVEMSGIADAVAMDYTESQRLPLDNFPDFLRKNMREAKGGDKRDRGKDIWGTEYRLAASEKGFEVRSAGPDTQWGTGDDLVKSYDLTGIDKLPANHAASASRQATVSPTPIDRPTAAQTIAASGTLPEETERKVIEFQKRRAAQGSPTSQYDLSLRFLEGNGLEKDTEQARMWMRKAAEGGNPQAKQHLELLGWDKAVSPQGK